jgi:streptogramin lyase
LVTKYQAGSRQGGTFGTGPESITTGPDGNIWFTEIWSGRIGRLTPSGVLTEFPAASTPRGIVTGPDGNLWFAVSNLQGPAVGRITPTGVVTTYPISLEADLFPYAIAAGPDRNLWFTLQSNGRVGAGAIGRITPGGSITTFALPQGSRPLGIAEGPDRNLWFTDTGGNTVGRITPTGSVRQFPLPRRLAQPIGIATGSDGRIWFTEAGVNRIGSIGTTSPEANLSSHVLTFNLGSMPRVGAVTIKNSGEATLKIAGVAIVGSDREAFTTTSDGCLGRTVAVSASCRIEISFTGSSDLGVKAARLAISDNATGSPHTVSLVARLPDCKLPLLATTPDSLTSRGEFLSLRDGVVVDDPSGRYLTASSSRLSQSQASPTLVGYGSATYVRAAKRWVPSGDRGISPDGSRYAYVDYQQPGDRQLHIVDIATGRDRTLQLPSGFWWPIGFTNDGVYLHQGYEGIGADLKLVNPDSGAVRTIFSDSTVYLVSGQLAWISSRDETDPAPPPPSMGQPHNQIQSRDLNTSQKKTWLYRSGSIMYVAAATTGSIVVSVWDATSNVLMVVTTPGQAAPITVPETDDPIPTTSGMVADANSWWFGTLDGIYLWTPHTGAILVSELTAAPAGTCA